MGGRGRAERCDNQIKRQVEDLSRRILGKYDGLKYGWLKDAKKFLLLVLFVFLMFRLVIGFSFVREIRWSRHCMTVKLCCM